MMTWDAGGDSVKASPLFFYSYKGLFSMIHSTITSLKRFVIMLLVITLLLITLLLIKIPYFL